MKLLMLPEARKRLEPFTENVLVKPCADAVKTYANFVATMPQEAAAISPTTRAGMIHDWTTRNVRGALCEGSRELSGYGFFTVLIGTDLAVRYKYVGAGLPSNVRTNKQALLAVHRYDDDLMQALAIDGVAVPPTLVTCGYKLGGDGQIQSLVVQCDYGNGTLWRHYLYGEPGVAGNYENLPLDPDDSLGTTIVRSTRKDDRTDREAK